MAPVSLRIQRIVMASREASLVRLLQLVSPTLPTGSFSYSQGLEWAVEAGWVGDAAGLRGWLTDCLHRSMGRVDIPLLRQMYLTCKGNDRALLEQYCHLLLACRESKELRAEEGQRGRAMTSLLHGLGLIPDELWSRTLCQSQLAGFAFAAAAWEIDLESAALGYVWAWLENQVIAGVKIIPLGQTAGQHLLVQLGEIVPEVVATGLTLPEDEIGASSAALALASCFHENQYTRLYRS